MFLLVSERSDTKVTLHNVWRMIQCYCSRNVRRTKKKRFWNILNLMGSLTKRAERVFLISWGWFQICEAFASFFEGCFMCVCLLSRSGAHYKYSSDTVSGFCPSRCLITSNVITSYPDKCTDQCSVCPGDDVWSDTEEHKRTFLSFPVLFSWSFCLC